MRRSGKKSVILIRPSNVFIPSDTVRNTRFLLQDFLLDVYLGLRLFGVAAGGLLYPGATVRREDIAGFPFARGRLFRVIARDRAGSIVRGCGVLAALASGSLESVKAFGDCPGGWTGLIVRYWADVRDGTLSLGIEGTSESRRKRRKIYVEWTRIFDRGRGLTPCCGYCGAIN